MPCEVTRFNSVFFLQKMFKNLSRAFNLRNYCASLLRNHFVQNVPSYTGMYSVTNFHTSSINLQRSAAEEQIIKILAETFPKATDIAVVDVSGGCGSMYEVHVQAPDFKNLRIVKQHQLVTKALASQIKDMHGIRISTSSSPEGCGCC